MSEGKLLNWRIIVKIALTFSINWARYWGMMSLKEAFPEYRFTEVELQTCPVQITANHFDEKSWRKIILTGECRELQFEIQVHLQKQSSGRWKLGVITGILHSCAFDWIPKPIFRDPESCLVVVE